MAEHVCVVKCKYFVSQKPNWFNNKRHLYSILLTFMFKFTVRFSSRGKVKKLIWQTYMVGLVGWEMAKGNTYLYNFFFVTQTHFLVQILVNFGGNFFMAGNRQGYKEDCGWEGIQKGVATIFSRPQNESQSDGKIICLKSYLPMSSKTQIQQRGKILTLKTFELSEYQKIYYQI